VRYGLGIDSQRCGCNMGLLVASAKLSHGKVVTSDQAPNTYGNGDPAGTWVGRLAAGGPLLAYNRWKVVCRGGDADGVCPSDAYDLTGKSLARVVAGRRAVLRRRGSSPLLAVGGGRMAVATGRSVAVLSPSGSLIADVPVSVPPRAVSLSSTRLAVQSPLTLDLYDPATGKQVKSLALGSSASFELSGVNAKLALLRGPDRGVLVRLGDGKLISLALKGLVDAKLTDAGLFYAYNTPKAAMKGHVVFEPTAKLLVRF
jgi:hypothetical protein